jgi:DNA-binding transcriptional ArsR family regulator
MMRFELGVEDLADTRFAISPLAETVFSLWELTVTPGSVLHQPWLKAARRRLDALDTRLLRSLVGEPRGRFATPSRAIPDFLTPRPTTFQPALPDELAIVRATPADVVRRDALATHAPGPLPDALRAVLEPGDDAIRALLDAVCDQLERLWDVVLRPVWSRLRLIFEADTTYRARQFTTGGARLLFADIHPNLTWHDGVLTIEEVVGHHHVAGSGRGLLLVPSVFACKPVPPVSTDAAPWLAYPSRGVATLWEPAADANTGATALTELLGRPRARLLQLLGEPISTSEIARRLHVTPSAVSQHLMVLHDNGLVTRARDGRHVLYRRSPLGSRLVAPDEN